MRREIAWAASLLGSPLRWIIKKCSEGLPVLLRKGGEWWPAVLRKFREALLVVAISLVVLEIALQATVRLGYFNLSLPSYSIATIVPFWEDLDEHFGVWHRPQVRYRHRKSCFDITYTSNSHGMRDKEVALSSQVPRVVVLGDSFVEGFGIEDGSRFTDRLAQKTGIEHLNFGTSGDFGTTQSYVLYKTLASKFDHGAVIFSLFPSNDFFDDLATDARLSRGARYRPYLVGRYPDYELRYPAGGLSKDYQLDFRLWNAIREFTLTGRAAEYAVTVTQQTIASAARGSVPKKGTSLYFEYPSDGFDRLRYALENIKAIAGDRPVLIFTIPMFQDYDEASRTPGIPPLTRELRALSDKLGITYVDLLEKMSLAELFESSLQCDFHWSQVGHQKVAEIIAQWKFYRGLH